MDVRLLLKRPDLHRQQRDAEAIDDPDEFRGAFGFRGPMWRFRAARFEAICLKRHLKLSDEQFKGLARSSALTVSPWGVHEWPGIAFAVYGIVITAMLLALGFVSTASAATLHPPIDVLMHSVLALVVCGGGSAIVWLSSVTPWRAYRAAVPPGALTASRQMARRQPFAVK